MQDELVKICSDFPELKFSFHYYFWETDFLRFYQSQTNYNISKKSITLQATIHKGKKSYSFAMYDPSNQKVREKIEDVQTFIDQLPEDPDFVDLEDDLARTNEIEKVNNIDKMSLETKLAILNQIAESVIPYNFKIFGTFICNYRTLFFINSNGLNKREIASPIMLELKGVSSKNDVTVLETFGSENSESFNIKAFIANLLLKVQAACSEVVDVEPGEYEVILAPRCIGEFFGYLTESMSARSLDSKDSFFEGKLNQKLFPENVTLIDDPNHPKMMNFDYNYDGHIYKKLPLIDHGVFKNYLVDNYYGRKLQMDKNGASANALVMSEGDKSLSEMLKTVKNGLYISSLHYMNYINHKETSVTGLTRDGTFLIENGNLTKVVNNLRFTERITDVIKGITEIENQSYTVPFSENYEEFDIESVRMPHVKVQGFKISSSTRTI
jgi:predicted Zn-dependent protease